MLIDASYFVGMINIPNKDNNDVLSLIDWYIGKYEVDILRDCLGMDLYRQFMTALGQTPAGSGQPARYLYVSGGVADPENVSQEWIDLLNGKEYVGLDSRLHKWQGFIAVTDDTSPAKSLIANYVYYQIMKNRATITMGIGEVVADADGASNVSVNDKAVAAWNEMVEWIHDLIWFLDYSIATYGFYEYYPGWWLQNRYKLLARYKVINRFNL